MGSGNEQGVTSTVSWSITPLNTYSNCFSCATTTIYIKGVGGGFNSKSKMSTFSYWLVNRSKKKKTKKRGTLVFDMAAADVARCLPGDLVFVTSTRSSSAMLHQIKAVIYMFYIFIYTLTEKGSFGGTARWIHDRSIVTSRYFQCAVHVTFVDRLLISC